jgi:hypothetical protein
VTLRYLATTCLMLLVVSTGLAEPAVAASTRAEYVAQADPYCAAANQDIRRLNRRARKLFRAGHFAAAGGEIRKTGRRLSASIAQVRAIPPPPGDEQTIASWLNLVQQIANNNLRLGRAEAKDDVRRILRIEMRTRQISVQAHGVVAGFGFTACVDSG